MEINLCSVLKISILLLVLRFWNILLSVIYFTSMWPAICLFYCMPSVFGREVSSSSHSLPHNPQKTIYNRHRFKSLDSCGVGNLSCLSFIFGKCFNGISKLCYYEVLIETQHLFSQWQMMLTVSFWVFNGGTGFTNVTRNCPDRQ